VASSGTGTGGPNSSELPSGFCWTTALEEGVHHLQGPGERRGEVGRPWPVATARAPAVHDDFVQGRGSSHLGGHVLPACECRAGPGRAGEASGVGARPLSLRRILRPAALKAWQRLSIWSRISPTVVAWHGVGASSWSSRTARTVRPRLVWRSAVGRSCLQHIGKLVQHVVPACTYLLRHLGQRVGQRARLFVRSQNCREATSSRNIAAMV